MATFSLGAPGVYINESAGLSANAAVASFSTVYMLVETEENVSTTRFPFNTPIPVTSLVDYRVLLGGVIPTERIPALSYTCVNEFFQNAQIGDLRVVRVGTPNQIVEIELFPSGTKLNTTALPSALMAGNIVYVQAIINGIRLVAGDGATGYTADGEYLGVPVEIPVNYVAGDEVNNRKIAAAMANAVAGAIESNPAMSSSVYVRDFGLSNDLNPLVNSETGYVTISATTFDGNVSVVTEVAPVGVNFVFMQNAYGINNIVGQQGNIERVPQDYTQTINTAFEGLQDQGYLITPTAYAQFDAAGRALVGAAAAAHCASNNFKWMALADPGPYLVTDQNKYSEYTPHQAAANFITGLNYLVDNAIYKWTGSDVSYDRLTYQTIVGGSSAETAVNESANVVADTVQVGILDAAVYTVNSVAGQASLGKFQLDPNNFWPVTLPIQEVTLSGASGVGNDFYSLNGTTVYIIAPPFDIVNSGDYSNNVVFITTNPISATAIYNEVVLAGGSTYVLTAPTGSFSVASPTGSTCSITYGAPYWDVPATINGQTSDLIENISGAAAGVNTLHLPGTLQSATDLYRLNFVNRTIFNPSNTVGGVSNYGGPLTKFTGAVNFNATNHGLINGQKVFFTQPITATTTTTSNLVSATNKLVSVPYWVTVIDINNFVLSSSLSGFTVAAYVNWVAGAAISSYPTIFYTQIFGGGINVVTPIELLTIPVIRARKYEFDTSSIFNQAAATSVALAPAAINPTTSIYLNNSSVVLGEEQINPYGEDLSVTPFCGWLPSLNLVPPTLSPSAVTQNAYCVPTVDQFFQTEAFMVPTVNGIAGGNYNAATPGLDGPLLTVTNLSSSAFAQAPGTYYNVPVTPGSGVGVGAVATVVVSALNVITSVSITNGGNGYKTADTGLGLTGAGYAGFTMDVATVSNVGSVTSITTYTTAAGVVVGDSGNDLVAKQSRLVGVYFDVTGAGVTPDGVTAVVIGDRISVTFDGSSYTWVVVPAAALGGDLTTIGQVLYGSQVQLVYTAEQAPPSSLWRFDAITSTELIDNALRGVGFNGVPQAVFIERGIDNVNALYNDSQRYFNPFGFIAYYGPWIENGSGVYVPPSPYVTGVAARRYRSEGYQFPPAGVKYQLADAVAAQIPINSAQQNLLNPDGCNAIRTLPGYPNSAVFIWGGRTRVNTADAQQRLYQFVNTRVILNVVYGSLRSAFDTQIFNVIDGFGVVFNQIISVGNSVLNQLYVRGALFGARPSDAFQVICDRRINSNEDLENGIVNAKVFVTPVPTLERIQIDLVRVAIGQMQNELNLQGLGDNNG